MEHLRSKLEPASAPPDASEDVTRDEMEASKAVSLKRLADVAEAWAADRFNYPFGLGE